jgi:C1A family cysteine protease
MAKKLVNVRPRRHYGWHPDRPDHRDVMFAASPASQGVLPASVDLRKQCPPIFDQGQLGSCTANAISAAYRFDLLKQKIDVRFVPSRLFIYYNERAMEGTIKSDSGAAIRDGIKSIAKQGVCSEAKLPYDVAKFSAKPSAACFAEAKAHMALSYQRVPQSIAQMKACLAAGYPFVFGFTVYESFESAAVAKSGVLNLPVQSEKTVGGHAVLAVGYDDAAQRIMVQNSWGDAWGQKGYFTMPYAYINDSDLAEDFWTVRLVG